MGSLFEEEDENLEEMVRDFIESDQSISLIHQTPIKDCKNPTFLSLKEILGNAINSEKLVREKILKYLREMDIEEEKIQGWSKNVKRLMMKFVVASLKMEKFDASVCLSSWVSAFSPSFTHFSTFGRPSVFEFTGEYEYMDVMIEDEKNGGEKSRLVIDMDFRSQFEVVRPTESYTEIKNALPIIFVGSESKLNSIINLVCSAAKVSLKESGLHIPPWRKVGYMKSKWLSTNYERIPLV